MKVSVVKKLAGIGACADAVKWAKTQSDPAIAWANCERADWMLWLLGRLAGPVHSKSRRKLVGCAGECAATAIDFVKSESLKKDLTEVALIIKRYSESEAAGTAADAEMIFMRKKAADASADASAGARKEALKRMADIVRRHYPEAPALAIESVGVKPDKLEPQTSYPVVHCYICGAAAVYAYDDRFPEDLDQLHRRLVDFDPEADRGRGDVVLWYEVDEAGQPVGAQFFRRVGDITGEHTGSVWRFHRNTCKGAVVI